MSLSTWFVPEIVSVVIFGTIALYVYYKFFIFNFWRKKGVFYMEPTFPTGNITALIFGTKSQADYVKDIYDRNKKHRAFGIYMFQKPFLVVNDPSLIRIVLTKDFMNFHDRGVFCNEKTDPLSGQLFQLPGKKWRTLRVKLTPTFTSGKIKSMFFILKESADRLGKFLDEQAKIRGTIDVKDVYGKYSIDIIMSAAFGINLDSFRDPDNEFNYWGKKVFEPNIFWNAIVIWAPHILDKLSMPFTDRGVSNFFIKMFEDTVNYRDANNIERKDFLNLLMQLMKNGYVDVDESSDEKDVTKKTETKLTMLEAAAQAYVFYLAGFETSSTTVTFCLYELAKHQDMQDKLREEIRIVTQKHGEITYNAVNEMTYLHKVISETLRKYPPLVMLNRICTEEIKIETTDIHIPTGTSVLIPVYGLHRDPDIYPDPDKFDPERFSEENIKTRHPYAYLPFGEGPRICIGLRFGLIQSKVAIISSLLRSKFKLAPDTPTSLEMKEGSLILMAKGGVHLTIEPVQ
ncbi:putative cytochrome P450 6a20 [Osmia lignaria lignaria]|uniref:putative cytochrome P450 6a20 n=1 Tax=Osmia lignaria lignaria TaxID=1437193 RepID=UPI00402B8DE8